MNVHIIQCDAKAQQDDVITSEDDMEALYGELQAHRFPGGTDFRPAFEYVNELCRKKVFRHLKGLLYFTDGYGTTRPDVRITMWPLFSLKKVIMTDMCLLGPSS